MNTETPGRSGTKGGVDEDEEIVVLETPPSHSRKRPLLRSVGGSERNDNQPAQYESETTNTRRRVVGSSLDRKQRSQQSTIVHVGANETLIQHAKVDGGSPAVAGTPSRQRVLQTGVTRSSLYSLTARTEESEKVAPLLNAVKQGRCRDITNGEKAVVRMISPRFSSPTPTRLAARTWKLAKAPPSNQKKPECDINYAAQRKKRSLPENQRTETTAKRRKLGDPPADVMFDGGMGPGSRAQRFVAGRLEAEEAPDHVLSATISQTMVNSRSRDKRSDPPTGTLLLNDDWLIEHIALRSRTAHSLCFDTKRVSNRRNSSDGHPMLIGSANFALERKTKSSDPPATTAANQHATTEPTRSTVLPARDMGAAERHPKVPDMIQHVNTVSLEKRKAAGNLDYSANSAAEGEAIVSRIDRKTETPMSDLSAEASESGSQTRDQCLKTVVPANKSAPLSFSKEGDGPSLTIKEVAAGTFSEKAALLIQQSPRTSNPPKKFDRGDEELTGVLPVAREWPDRIRGKTNPQNAKPHSTSKGRKNSGPLVEVEDGIILRANDARVSTNPYRSEIHNISRDRDDSECDGVMSMRSNLAGPLDQVGSRKSDESAEVYSIEDFHRCLEFGCLDDIKRGLCLLQRPFEAMGMSTEQVLHLVKALLTRTVELEDGSRGAAIHLWARNRYGDPTSNGDDVGNSEGTSNNRRVLECADVNLDALDSLQLILDHGAQVFSTDSYGQTPLSLGMAEGYDCIVNALLEKVVFDVDQLNKLNHRGEMALQLALLNGHFSCVRLFMKKCDTDTLLRLRDAEENNALALLAQFTDVRYGLDDCTVDVSQSFVLFRELLDRIGRDEMIEALLNENVHGENAMHIAAKGGCYYEVLAISKLEFGSGRSIANRCVGSLSVIKGSNELVSPLDIAMETREMVMKKMPLKKLRKRAQFARSDYDSLQMEKWTRNGIEPTIKLLQEIQRSIPIAISDALSSRPAGSKISKTQILSEEAEQFREANIGPLDQNATGEPKIYLYEMKNIKRSNGEGFRSQIAKCLEKGTIPQVSGALIRDPKHSCVRNSAEPTARQYCLLAVGDIAAGTVITEYAGVVRREVPHDCVPDNSYAFKLQRLDEWVMKSADSCYESSFILDARVVFNESSLINDIRTDVLERGRPEREENVGCKEVLVNKWPRIFLVSTRDIEAGEELITDYGPSYWEKHVLSILKKREESNRACIEQLLKRLAQQNRQEE